MYVSHLSLLNFRNYQRLELALDPGKVLILGRNGQGKTNLAEAIYYFDSLRSHRVSGDAPLALRGSAQTVVRLQISHQHSSPTLELELRPKLPKRAQINGNPVRPRELTRWVTAVVFAPEDLQIVRGDPNSRRDFLDTAIVTRNPYFSAVFKEYERVVKQRTALLKTLRARGLQNPSGDGFGRVGSTLDFWNQQLIDAGTRIMAERRFLVDSLQSRLAAAYQRLVAADHRPFLRLRESAAAKELYEPQLSDVSRETSSHFTPQSRESLTAEFTAALKRCQQKELLRGVTLAGPHRDELELELNSLPVKGYASHGESWSFALGMKLALAELLRQELAPEDPLLLLDDVFAELDAARRQRLLAAVNNYQQVLVTAAVAEDIPSGNTWQIHVIKNGKILASGSSDNPAEFFAQAQ